MKKRWWLVIALVAVVALYVAEWATLCADCPPSQLLYPWRILGL